MASDLERLIRRALSGALAIGAGIALCLAGIHDWTYDLYHDRRAPLADTLAYLANAALLLALAAVIRSSRPSGRDFGVALAWAIGGFIGTFAIFAALMFSAGMFM